MKKNKRVFYSLIMLIALLFNIFVPRNIVSVEANEIDKTSINILKFKEITCGANHVLAIDINGNLWAWGRNDFGQLGDGTTNSSNVPINIMKGHKFSQIAASRKSSIAIDEQGYCYKWGNSVLLPTLVDTNNDYISINGNSSNDYDSIACSRIGDSIKSVPIQKYVGNSVYGNHYLFLNSNGNLYDTNYLYLYDNNFIDVDGNFNYNHSYTGMYAQNLLGISFDNKLVKKFSHSASASWPSYFDYIDLSLFDNKTIKDIAVQIEVTYSFNKICGFVIDCNNNLYSFGKNTGTNLLGCENSIYEEEILKPVLVSDSIKFSKIDCGVDFAVALGCDGNLYSWGANSYGQLGIGSSEIMKTPTLISKLSEQRYFSFVSFLNEKLEKNISLNNALSYDVLINPNNGSALINEYGLLTYIPNNDYYGRDYLEIKINYPGYSINIPIEIYIDRKPVFIGDTPSFNVECGESYTGVAPATDPDNHNLTYSIVKQPLKGEVVLNNNAGSFTYTAGTELAGNDSFTIGVSDGYCIVEYPVNVHIQSLISYDDETTINIDLLRNNTYSSNINAEDIDGDSLSYSISKLPVKGNVTIDNEGNYTYTADGDKYGEDTFTIKIDDGYKPLEVKYTINLFTVSDDGTTLAKTITQGTTYSDVIKTNANGVSPIYSIKSQPKNGNVVIDSDTGEYTYTPNVGSVGEDFFEVLVDYTYGQYVLTIHIYQNTIPSDSNVSLDITTNENVNYIGSAACVDIDGDTLSYSIKNKPSKGSVSINPTTGEYTYYPNKDVAGNDFFEVLVNDGTDSIIININVHIESLIVTEKIINKTISQNTSLSSKINASDKDGDILRYSIDSNPINGIANIDSLTGEYIYIPFNNYYGSDSFVIKVDDGVKAELVTINIKVNRRPISDQITINLETNGITVTGSAECSDPDGDTLIYSIESNPNQGYVIINESTGAFAYTPNSNAAGNDTFTIKATDGCDDIIITVVVHNETELNIDTSNNTIVVNQGKSTTGKVEAIDEDGDTLTYSIVNYPIQGTINLNEHTGAWTYNALKNAKGTDTFTISITDGNTTKTITYTLLINTPAEFNSNVDTNLTTNVNENYTGKVEAQDEDGDSLTYTIVSQGNKGTVSIDSSSGRYIYVPNENAAGDDTFIIGVSDGNFVTEIEIHIHIESDIEIENSILNSEVDKGSITTGKVDATDKDGDTLTYSIYQQGEKGTANVTNDGNWSYFAGEGAGNDSFVIAISDGTHTKYVTVYVHISTKPIFEENNITINVSEGSSTNGKVNGSDEDGDTLTYEVTSQPENGTLNLNSQTGEYTYTVFSNSEASEDVFIITVSDGENTSSITVRVIINNAPEVEDSTITINQDGSGNGMIEVEDPEGDNITYTVGTQGNKGTVSINSSTGEYAYTTTDKNYSGTDTFTIVVSDGYNTQEVVVTVNIVKNTKPSANETIVELESDSSVSGKINGFDSEDDELAYSISYQGDKGTAVINESTGEFTYTSYKDTEGYDCFVVTISDGYNEVSYLVEVNITFVDSNNSWAIPTTIATGAISISSLASLLFVLLKKKKTM